MHIKIFFLIMCCLDIFINAAYGQNCAEKEILDGNKLMGNPYDDVSLIYNGVSSCVSLTSELNKACCYIKFKFKNSESKEKYTHKGCIQINLEEWNDIKAKIKSMKGNITTDYKNITLDKQKINIDCNSNYIKYVGLLLFTLLL